MSNATPEVLAMARINFSGNIIPNTWYDHLRYDNGKPNLNAIVILSDIVYWYRPAEIRDELTGQTIGYNKKFAADKLQRSYSQVSEQFGLTRKQARDAINFLEQKGVITKELRQVNTVNGPLSNVLFIGIVPEKIAEISLHNNSQVTPPDLQVTPPDLQVTPSLPVSHTYTETTTKNTTEILQKSSKPEKPEREQLNNLAETIAIICGNLDIEMIAPKTREALKAITFKLYQKGVAPADLTAFSAWWYDNTWQGQKSQPPTPQQLGDSWGQFEAARAQPASSTWSGPVLTPEQLANYERLKAMDGKPLEIINK